MDKKEYFQYYQPKNSSFQSSSSKERIQLERKRYENNKLLPHIAEEYHFRITNHLLLKKIISPKRDKIIMQSLSNLGKKGLRSGSSLHGSCTSSEKMRTMKSIRSLHHEKRRQAEGGEFIKARNTVKSDHRIRRKVFVNHSMSH